MAVRRHRRSAADASPDAFAPPAVHAYPDAELGHFRRPPYSVWSGVKYTLILSILLWWLPTIGQMIAGYIGGRRAGGPWRGVLAAVIPVVFIVVFAWGLESGILTPWLTTVATVPTAIASGIASFVPPLGPYVQFVLQYLGAFAEALRGTLSMGTNGYLVTIVFAYVGGILGEQARREAGYGRGTSVGISITQPLLSPFHRPAPIAWDEDHPERLEDLHRIPVRPASADAATAKPRSHRAEPRREPHKVETAKADSEPEKGARPARDAHGTPAHPPEPPTEATPKRQEWTAHDKEVATRRFVERALRQYEAAHRR